jgi:hypothetical protein
MPYNSVIWYSLSELHVCVGIGFIVLFREELLQCTWLHSANPKTDT